MIPTSAFGRPHRDPCLYWLSSGAPSFQAQMQRADALCWFCFASLSIARLLVRGKLWAPPFGNSKDEGPRDTSLYGKLPSHEPCLKQKLHRRHVDRGSLVMRTTTAAAAPAAEVPGRSTSARCKARCGSRSAAGGRSSSPGARTR